MVAEVVLSVMGAGRTGAFLTCPVPGPSMPFS